MNYSFRGLSVGTLRLKILIRTPPFDGFTQKGDAEMKDWQERRTPDRYSRENCISGPTERNGWPDLIQVYLFELGKIKWILLCIRYITW